MAITLESAARLPFSKVQQNQRRRNALLLGASAVLHATILGPMILLAVGDEGRYRTPPELPVIQVELERPPQKRFLPPIPFLRPKPPVVLKQETPVPPDVKPPEQQRVEPSPRPEVTLQTPLALNAPSAIQQPSVQVQPWPDPEEVEQLDRALSRNAPSPLTNTLPSLQPPRTESETLTSPSPLQAPASVTRTAPSVTQEQSAAASTTPSADDLPIRRKRDEENGEVASGAPSAPMPRFANPAPGALAPPAGLGSPVPGVSEAWRVAPSSQSDRNARALRTSPAGCRSARMLTRGEQQICDERFNADAAVGAQNPIRGTGNAQRDARFAREGARELQRYEMQRRPLSGGPGNVGPSDCPGSNLGIGCAGAHLDSSMQMDSNRNVQTRREGPPVAGRPMVPGGAAPREPQKPTP